MLDVNIFLAIIDMVLLNMLLTLLCLESRVDLNICSMHCVKHLCKVINVFFFFFSTVLNLAEQFLIIKLTCPEGILMWPISPLL